MKFSYYDLGSHSGGEIVEVTLSGNAANVSLVDSSNFSSFKYGRNYRYFGGHATRSPVRLQVPSSGHWYLVIDLGGYTGSVRHSMRILPGRLQPMGETPLSSVPSLFDPKFSPSLADKVARSTSTDTVEEIANEIIEVIDNAK